uniref:epoxide hydrolase A-like isoform X2 n=1 Tax=Erigeron canadensis TaxID=72917 RepID=UPI001CB9C733|nr:epoxide hydrolase A-like isoform X2 [Erigeron canadensis]
MELMMKMGDVNHHRIKTNGIWMHVAEKKGQGPFVLLLHGFPETWFSWRHQIAHLASHGYHVIAPDLRGCGDSDCPLSPSSYTMFQIVGDLIGILDHFNQQEVFVVGHDWGATAAWHLSLFRPERVKGMVAISVPFFPRNPDVKPSDFCKSFGDDFYMCQFQEAGRAERAFAKYDSLTVIKKFLSLNKTDILIAPPGMEIIDYLETPSHLPSWITEEELQVYADKFQESGFTGGLNYYRAVDQSWELEAPWQGSKITVPSKLIVGDKDTGFESFTKVYIDGDIQKALVPDIEVVILDGHHFIHQEKSQEVSDQILSFFQKLA